MSEAIVFSKPLLVASVPTEGLDVTLRPNEAEREALARANNLVAIEELEAHLRVARQGAEGLAVTGRVRAKIRQTCVVTLKPFDAEVDEPVEASFAPPLVEHEPPRGRSRDEAFFDETQEDGPDPIIDGAIDLGAIVTEFFTLGLDLYPRSPGAVFAEPAPESAKEGPFANLNLKLAERDRR